MRKCIVALLLTLVIIACKNKKVSLQGDEHVELNDFLEAFPASELPFTATDTSMRNTGDTATISYAIFKQFVPDTILNNPFGKERKLTIRPVARYEEKNKEKYLVTHVSSRKTEAIYLLVFDKQNKYSSYLPLLTSGGDKGGVTTASIDKKQNISINREWKGEEELYYQRNIYAYNNAGMFMLVLQETNDLSKSGTKELNPLDTFPKRNKFSGDYYKGKTNLVSLRDGKDANTYLFYIHFENNEEEKCGGELRGEMVMTSPGSGVFQENGNPCVVDFTLTANQVKVKEQGSCGNYRGIKCFFNDTFTKNKEPKTSRKKATS